MGPFLSVLIPAYNEEAGLEDCWRRLTAKLRELGVAAELLIVDDCSRDRTGLIADELAARDVCVRVFHHAHNRGIGGSFVTGVAQARGEWLILMPADLPLALSELHKYFDAAPGADVVVGLRSDRSDYTWLRKVVSFTNIFLVRTLFGMRQRQFQYVSMYRLAVLREMDIDYWRSAFFLAEILIKAKALGRRLVEVDILYAPRLTGRATGAKLRLIILTVRDLFHFWVRWIWLRPAQVARRRVPG